MRSFWETTFLIGCDECMVMDCGNCRRGLLRQDLEYGTLGGKWGPFTKRNVILQSGKPS